MASPVRFAVIRKQLEAAGYRLARIQSSHHIFEKPGQTLVVIPVHRGKVKPVYARKVEKIIAAEDEEREGGKRQEHAEREARDESQEPEGDE